MLRILLGTSALFMLCLVLGACQGEAAEERQEVEIPQREAPVIRPDFSPGEQPG